MRELEANLRELQRQIQSTCMEFATHTRSHEEYEQTKNCLYKEEHYEKFVWEEFKKLKNCRVFRKDHLTNSTGKIEKLSLRDDLTAQISESQERLEFF